MLAVGFIFTIHFFNTHFRLDKFPMDPVIFTGRVPLDKLKRDKPREYERLAAGGELEETLVDPYPRGLERAFKIYGFTALGVGLTLIALIVYSMLFGYRRGGETAAGRPHQAAGDGSGGGWPPSPEEGM